MTTFAQLGLSKALIHALAQQAITVPTAIQTAAIPPLCQWQDVIGQAHTGSGKTLAYLCPLFLKIDPSRREMQALILAPTHELVMQIYRQAQDLAQNSGLNIRSINIIGEANINNQITRLKDKPQLIIGTPGRILDLIQKRKINAQTIKTIVIDEVDNLLANTNRQTVLDVIKTTQRDRQLAAFSASLNAATLTTLQELMTTPQLIELNTRAVLNPHIDHYYLLGEQRDKFELLRKLLHAENPQRALIFLNDGERIDLLCDKLNYHHYQAYPLFGDLTKEERQKAMNDFRSGKIRLLVSSDLAARGLDIPDITHVINLDFPLEANEYVHRAGRTARGERTGICYSIVNPTELAALRIYQREFAIDIQPVHLVRGKVLPGAVKQHYSKTAAEKKAAKGQKTTVKKSTPPKSKSQTKSQTKPTVKKPK